MNNYKMPATFLVDVHTTVEVFDEEDIKAPRMVAVADDATQDALRFWPTKPLTDENVHGLVMDAIAEADSTCSSTYYLPTQTLTLDDVQRWTVHALPSEEITDRWRATSLTQLKQYERAMVGLALPRRKPRPLLVS